MIETELVVARMQNRRGRRADLPQPLMPGELGFCTDTGQLFIGADSNTNMTPGIETFTRNVDATIQANTLGADNIIQITVTPGNPMPDYAMLGFVPDYQIVVDNIMYLGWNNANNVQIPVLGPEYFTRFFIDIALNPTNFFIKGEVIMPTYTQEDAGAVASIFNSIQFWQLTSGATPPQDPYTYTGITGIVTTKQNIEIFTEYSPGRGLPIKRILPPVASWAPVPGVTFTYSDALVVDYSLQSTGYSRTGDMKIICSPDNGTDPVKGTLFDIGTSLDNDGSTPLANIEFILSPGANLTPSQPDLVLLNYRTPGISTDVVFTTSTKIWQSF
jgi:hypothetical protein